MHANKRKDSLVARLKRSFRRAPLLTAGFVLAVVLATLFAVRTVVFMVYWSNPANHQRAPEPWMTPRFVARSWHVPPETVIDALGLKTMPARNHSLARIAQESGLPVETLEKRLNDALSQAPTNGQ